MAPTTLLKVSRSARHRKSSNVWLELALGDVAEPLADQRRGQAFGDIPTYAGLARGLPKFLRVTVLDFCTTKVPECVLHIHRAGGILVACDALQNFVGPNEHFSDEPRQTMQETGFFQPADFGPVWFQINEPKARDFVRLQELAFRHALCGHGPPLRDTAQEAYTARFQRVFGAG